jgi:hypothetical protein
MGLIIPFLPGANIRTSRSGRVFSTLGRPDCGTRYGTTKTVLMPCRRSLRACP